MHYSTRFSLLNFLQARRVTEGAGSIVYFKVHDKQATYLVLDEHQQELGTTTRDAFMLYLTTYATTLVEQTPDGFQVWELSLDSLKGPGNGNSEMAMSFIRR